MKQLKPRKIQQGSAGLSVLGIPYRSQCVNETPPGKLLSLPFLLKLSPLPIFPFQPFNPFNPSKMSSVARAVRPFASRVLAQKPLAPACRASPAFRFPRGTRSFSQSPLCEYCVPPMLSRRVYKILRLAMKHHNA